MFNDIIREEVLFQVPNGLRCHLIDISMEELAKVNASAPMSLTEATFLDCLDPYFALAQNSDDAMVHGRVMENIFEKFLLEYSVLTEEEKEDVMDQVHVGTIAKFLFELGSDVDTQERYRKPLYDMHKTYMKRLKKVGKDAELDVGDSPDDSMEVIEEEKIVDEMEADRAEPKKRKRKAAKDAAESNDASLPTEGRQSHKKKRTKNQQEADVPSEEVVAEAVSQSTEKKKHKKKKKKRKSSISSNEGDSGSKGSEKEEEVITISVSEQKKAAEDIKEQSSAKKKNHKKTPVKTTKAKELTSEEKRVKFRAKNHSKSYKASMKALETVKHTPNKTPEHGILRSKITSPGGQSREKSSKKKRSRKKRASPS